LINSFQMINTHHRQLAPALATGRNSRGQLMAKIIGILITPIGKTRQPGGVLKVSEGLPLGRVASLG
jgi:hypothetical protein